MNKEGPVTLRVLLDNVNRGSPKTYAYWICLLSQKSSNITSTEKLHLSIVQNSLGDQLSVIREFNLLHSSCF